MSAWRGWPGAGLRTAPPAPPLTLAALPEPLARLLDPASGPLLPPVRAEVFGPQRFALHGHSLGLTHAAAPKPTRVWFSS